MCLMGVLKCLFLSFEQGVFVSKNRKRRATEQFILCLERTDRSDCTGRRRTRRRTGLDATGPLEAEEGRQQVEQD